MGVPWGEMKGVEDSEADPKVAAREMSDPALPLGCCWRAGPGPGVPGSRCSGSADPEECLHQGSKYCLYEQR